MSLLDDLSKADLSKENSAPHVKGLLLASFFIIFMSILINTANYIAHKSVDPTVDKSAGNSPNFIIRK